MQIRGGGGKSRGQTFGHKSQSPKAVGLFVAECQIAVGRQLSGQN